MGSSALKAAIMYLGSKKPEERPAEASEVKKMAWCSSMNWGALAKRELRGSFVPFVPTIDLDEIKSKRLERDFQLPCHGVMADGTARLNLVRRTSSEQA